MFLLWNIGNRCKLNKDKNFMKNTNNQRIINTDNRMIDL